MRGKLSATKQWRLSVVGIPLAALMLLVAAEIDTEPVRYPSVTGEHHLEASSVGALERSDPIELTTSAVGLRWPNGGSGEAAVRISDDGVDWGPWIPIHADDHEPDENSGEGSSAIASEAVYTAGSSWIQFQWEGATPVVDFVDTSGSTLGIFDQITAQLQRLTWSTESTAVAAVDQPEILPRSAWGGQDCVAPETSYNSETRAEVVIVLVSRRRARMARHWVQHTHRFVRADLGRARRRSRSARTGSTRSWVQLIVRRSCIHRRPRCRTALCSRPRGVRAVRRLANGRGTHRSGFSASGGLAGLTHLPGWGCGAAPCHLGASGCRIHHLSRVHRLRHDRIVHRTNHAGRRGAHLWRLVETGTGVR